MVIGRCERSNDVIEPRIKTQWFIKVRPMADKAMASVRDGRTDFVPRRYRKMFYDWMENIHDWNVSRQLWWGHRIPAWYCPDGHVTVSDLPEGPTACDACGRPAAELTQEPDIFDTWFSSGLWPFSTLGWPDDTPDLRTYYPTSVMETGYDIIFFWVARMMMLGEWLTGLPPFHTVYLHGIVRDAQGSKMSKTKGNVLDPLEVIDEMGADALRFALLNGPEPSQDQKMSRPRLEEGRNFANKLWNAARFVRRRRGRRRWPQDEPLAPPAVGDLGAADEWILARCAPDDRGGRGGVRGIRVRPRRAPALRRDLERVLRLVSRDGEAAALAADAAAGATSGDVADAGVGARSLPAPAASADAARDRGDLGPSAAPHRRSGPAHRRALAVG